MTIKALKEAAEAEVKARQQYRATHAWASPDAKIPEAVLALIAAVERAESAVQTIAEGSTHDDPHGQIARAALSDIRKLKGEQ